MTLVSSFVFDAADRALLALSHPRSLSRGRSPQADELAIKGKLQTVVALYNGEKDMVDLLTEENKQRVEEINRMEAEMRVEQERHMHERRLLEDEGPLSRARPSDRAAAHALGDRRDRRRHSRREDGRDGARLALALVRVAFLRHNTRPPGPDSATSGRAVASCTGRDTGEWGVTGRSFPAAVSDAPLAALPCGGLVVCR